MRTTTIRFGCAAAAIVTMGAVALTHANQNDTSVRSATLAQIGTATPTSEPPRISDEEASRRLAQQLNSGWIPLLGSSADGAGPNIVGYVSTNKMRMNQSSSEAPGEKPMRVDDPNDHVQPVYLKAARESEIVGYRLDGLGFVRLDEVEMVLADPDAAVARRQVPIPSTESSARASIAGNTW